MLKLKSERLTPLFLGTYCVSFYLVWAALNFTLFPFMQSQLSNGWLCEIIEAVIKTLVWALPALLIIKKYESNLLLRYSEIFKSAFKWKEPLLIAGGFILYNLVGSFSQKKEISISESFFVPDIIGAVLIAGFTEELVFRGLILNATFSRLGMNKAIALSGLMFLVIHFPLWMVQGKFIYAFQSGGIISVFALGCIFSWIFLKTKNIFVPIILHMLWNLLVNLLY